MKRYLVFSWTEYEQGGGWDDYEGTRATLAAAKKQLAAALISQSSTGLAGEKRMGHIVDTHTGEIVYENRI